MDRHIHRELVTAAIAAGAVVLFSGCHESGASDDTSQNINIARSDVNSMILSITRVIDANLSKDGFIYRACDGWVISEQDIRAFFLSADPITSEQKHSAYQSMPCAYEGKIQFGTFVYEYSINAGLHGYLRELNGSKRELYFGCKVKCVRLTPFKDIYEADR